MYGAPAQGVPAREGQRSDQVSDVSQQAASSDLLVNNLSYHQPEALSLAVQRAYSRQYFQRRSYINGETAVIDLNSGTDYCDPGNAYLTFNVLATASDNTDKVGFGMGSAMNLIKQVTIKSRSGTELDRIERANLWSCRNSLYTLSKAYLAGAGQMEGFVAPVDGVTPAAGVLYPIGVTGGATAAQRYAIPLKRLAPFFNPVKRGQKIPPQLLSGLHLEIIWADATEAFIQNPAVGTPNNVTGYVIDQLSIMLDNVCMTDDVQKVLNDQSANDGLEYAYPRIFTATDAVGASTSINTQVRKAVSQANMAFAVSLPGGANPLTYDSMASSVWSVTSLQMRLGALYYPVQAISDPTSDGVEGYAQALECFDRLKHDAHETGVSLRDFQAANTLATQVGGRAIMAVSLEKDTALNFSGLPVNNSRVLELLVTDGGTGGATRTVVTFLEYSAVARAYVDNTAVAI